jgi:hypothetical protein
MHESGVIIYPRSALPKNGESGLVLHDEPPPAPGDDEIEVIDLDDVSFSAVEVGVVKVDTGSPWLDVGGAALILLVLAFGIKLAKQKLT